MVSKDADDLLVFVTGGATFLEVLERLSARSAPTALTPLAVLRILQEELGISFVESRSILEYFDSQMRPIVDVNLINERGGVILRQCRS
ncbi:hypothetical protein [Streptomyces sp. NPDC048663]|uniref:hypothetical protein n=1 Tax=Streptomyces sp. NPDC048663 TaxID=3155638 RepID=UPI00341DA849